MTRQITLLILVTAMLAACASVSQQHAKAPIVDLESGPRNNPQASNASKAEGNSAASVSTSHEKNSGGYLSGDGPGADAPANLDNIPDAVPKAEPLHRYANRPYNALGKTYTPLETPGSYKEQGIASWYGKKFHGQRTSIGEVYDMYGMTAAHPTLPIPSYARITNAVTKKSVIVRVNDRGPFLHDRIIDLSYTAAYKLGLANSGSAEVLVESIAVDGSEPLTTSVVTTASVNSVALPVETVPPVSLAEIPQPLPASAPVSTTKEIPVAVAGSVYLQLGAFKSPQGAESFLAKMKSKLGDVGKSLSLTQKDGLDRIQLGPFITAEEARAAGEKLKARLGFKPFVSVH
jgi:rare lipoprotein A